MQTSEKIVNNSSTTLTLFQPKIRRKSPIEINSPVNWPLTQMPWWLPEYKQQTEKKNEGTDMRHKFMPWRWVNH